MASNHRDKAYVTLITKPSYLTGAIILAYSLRQCQSQYPLLILVTPALGKDAIEALELEAKQNPTIIVKQIEALTPREQNTGSAAARFADTYTKLRAFQLHEDGYKKCVFLDADMAVFQTPDELFDVKLPDNTWISANHACVCNLDFDNFAPPDWNKGNCAYTPIDRPDDPPTRVTPNSRPTYHLLNSGMFVYEPNKPLWDAMMHEFETSDKIKTYVFPDQDFMADFFRNRWQALSWKFNALKTMRSWHPRMYKDADVVVLHYIVDKPWNKRIASDKIAGHLGRDGYTHQQWWDIYGHWRKERIYSKDVEAAAIVAYVKLLIPPALTCDEDTRQVEANRKFQAPTGAKVAIKPFGTPPGELKDVSLYVPEDKQIHPYDCHFPRTPSEVSQQFDEAAGLALESLLRRSSLASNDVLTESEVEGPTTPDQDPEQHTKAALLYWFHKAQVLNDELEDSKHLTKLLETENAQLHSELAPVHTASRHKLPFLPIKRPVFLIGPPESEFDSPASPVIAAQGRLSDDFDDVDRVEGGVSIKSQVPPSDMRERLIIQANNRPSNSRERARFQQDRDEWAADPHEVDSIPAEERVDNILGHARKASMKSGLMLPLAESPGNASTFIGPSRVGVTTLSSEPSEPPSDDGKSQPIIATSETTYPLPFAFSPDTATNFARRQFHTVRPSSPGRRAGPSLLSHGLRSTSLTNISPFTGAPDILQATPMEDINMEESTDIVVAPPPPVSGHQQNEEENDPSPEVIVGSPPPPRHGEQEPET